MARGRPRKPDVIHKLAGTYRTDRHGDTNTKFEPGGQPSPPDWLSTNARNLWERVVPDLVAKGVAGGVDEFELSAMCDWWGRYRAVLQSLDTLEPTDKGYYRLQILAGTAWKNFSTIAAKFGMNPSDRARLRIEKPPEQRTDKSRFFDRLN